MRIVKVYFNVKFDLTSTLPDVTSSSLTIPILSGLSSMLNLLLITMVSTVGLVFGMCLFEYTVYADMTRTTNLTR